LHDAAWLVEVWLRNRQEIMGQPLLNFLETNEEIELFSKLLEVAKNYGKVK
jgi:hypothetical protein